jgi:hypothetical protein
MTGGDLPEGLSADLSPPGSGQGSWGGRALCWTGTRMAWPTATSLGAWSPRGAVRCWPWLSAYTTIRLAGHVCRAR